MSYKFREHIKNNTFVTTHVIKEDKVIYMRPGRSASTSIIRKFRKENEEVSRPYYLKSGTNEWLENITDDKISNDYFVFTFVRNPFERLVSAWNAFNKYRKAAVNSDFETFVKVKGVGGLFNTDGEFANDHWLPLSYYIEFIGGERFVDFIGRFEYLEEDWEKVKDKIGCGDTVIKKLSRGINKKVYRSYYNSELIEIVSSIYKRDLELFGYEF